VKLTFKQQHFEYNKTASVEEVIEKINELLLEGYYFSHFIADEAEVYENPEEYLRANLGRIKKLEVITKTEKEFLNDILISTEDYLKGTKIELAALPQAFYTNPTAETWTSFELLLEGAGWLNDVLAVIANSKKRPTNWEAYTKLQLALDAEVAKLSEAVQQKNNKQIGDIIQNGIIPNFNALEVEVRVTNDTIGVRQNLN